MVIAIPPSNELRKEMETLLKQKVRHRSGAGGGAGAEERQPHRGGKKAGVSYFDAIICGTGTATGLTHDGMLEPMESFWILPEVKDPKQWWGGHIWEDNSARTGFYIPFSPT